MRWDDHQSFPRGGGRGVCTFSEGKTERGKGGNKESQDARMEMGKPPCSCVRGALGVWCSY